VSRAMSSATGRAYGLARVARVWHLSRATVYRHRAAPDPAAPAGPTRRGPVGVCSDAALLEHIRAQILGSRLHGEGYRKIWARLRHAGIRTSARRVRRLMGQHGLLAPHRVGRPEQRAHDGTITTTVVDAMWGTDMTETVTIREGRARVFVAVDHCSGESYLDRLVHRTCCCRLLIWSSDKEICQGWPFTSCRPCRRPFCSQSNTVCAVMPIAAAAPWIE